MLSARVFDVPSEQPGIMSTVIHFPLCFVLIHNVINLYVHSFHSHFADDYSCTVLPHLLLCFPAITRRLTSFSWVSLKYTNSAPVV